MSVPASSSRRAAESPLRPARRGPVPLATRQRHGRQLAADLSSGRLDVANAHPARHDRADQPAPEVGVGGRGIAARLCSRADRPRVTRAATAGAAGRGARAPPARAARGATARRWDAVLGAAPVHPCRLDASARRGARRVARVGCASAASGAGGTSTARSFAQACWGKAIGGGGPIERLMNFGSGASNATLTRARQVRGVPVGSRAPRTHPRR